MPELPFPLSWSPAPESWAYKEGVLAFEAPPEGIPMVVSVVTRGSSDDAKGA